MNREFEYYRVTISDDDRIPLLDVDTGSPLYQYEEEPIKNPKLMLFKLGSPVPKKPKMADYLEAPSSVISKKIYDVFASLKIYGVQLIPARVKGKNDEIFSDYWLLHIYNNVKCIDPELSDCEINDGRLGYVEKLILDEKKLETIPFEKRLAFRLEEDFSYILFHVSIVEVILAVNPEGIRFVNIEEWNEGSNFED